MRSALFLDRDGVINRDVDFAFQPNQIEWLPDIARAITIANQAGFLVLVVTNQSGVGRGIYTEQDVINLHKWMQAELLKQGAKIDDFAFCPHHPTEGQGVYKVDCDCRKPKAGMIKALAKKHNVDLSKSFLIGDKPSDAEAARAAGIRAYLYEGQNLADMVEKQVRT